MLSCFLVVLPACGKPIADYRCELVPVDRDRVGHILVSEIVLGPERNPVFSDHGTALLGVRSGAGKAAAGLRIIVRCPPFRQFPSLSLSEETDTRDGAVRCLEMPS